MQVAMALWLRTWTNWKWHSETMGRVPSKKRSRVVLSSGLQLSSLVDWYFPFPYLHLAYPDSVQSMRIRSSARVSVDLVTAINREQGAQGSARMTDISVGGARLVSPRAVANKDETVKVSFRINPAGLDVYMTLNARVRAVSTDESLDGLIATRIEFTDISEQDRLYLTNMVYQNLLKDTL